MKITKYTSYHGQVLNTDRKKQELQFVVTRHRILHSYLLPKKITFKYKCANYKNYDYYIDPIAQF